MSVLHRPPVRCSLLSFALAALVLGCSDSTGMRSQSDPQLRSQGLRLLEWRGPVAPRFSARGALANRGIGSGPDGVSLGSASDELSLENNTASFWAVRGETRSVRINYQSAGDVSQPFLELTTSDPAFVPGRGELALGDSVLLSITIDPTNLKVSLEPTGLQFGTPSRLEFWYGGAGGDLNGDGLVNDTDAAIESQILGLWYRESPDDGWTEISATHALEAKSFVGDLLHFSEYAVSYLSDYAVSW